MLKDDYKSPLSSYCDEDQTSNNGHINIKTPMISWESPLPDHRSFHYFEVICTADPVYHISTARLRRYCPVFQTNAALLSHAA